MDRWSMITPRTSSEFQYSNEKIRIESGIRWLFNGPGNGRYRSLPFPITIPFLVIAFFLFLPPSARILVSGTNRLFWHTFSLDYRDVDWLVEVFSSFLDGPSPIVAKVLIKSGRNCIDSRITPSLACELYAKLEKLVVVHHLEFEKERESYPSPIQISFLSKLIERCSRKGCSSNIPPLPQFLGILGRRGIGRGNRLCAFRGRAYYLQRASLPFERKETLKSLALCRIFYERKPSSFQIVVYFLESDLQTVTKSLSLSHSTCPLTRITSLVPTSWLP